MEFIIKLVFLIGCLLVLSVVVRDIRKFFRNGFGSNITISAHEGSLTDKYYIWSDVLFREFISLDSNGVAIGCYGNNSFYNPAYVAWHGLCLLNSFYETGDNRYVEELDKQVLWLRRNVTRDKHRGSIWEYEFDWREGRVVLRKPWISGMAQGLIISLLVRNYMLTKDTTLLEIAEQAAKVYEVSIKERGIKLTENSSVFYEEYPSERGVKILDGFIFALLGLHDFYQMTRDGKYLRMFLDGVETIEKNITYWDYRQKWSRYGNHRFLCTPTYNKLNSRLVEVLCSITKKDTFRRYSMAWDADSLSLRNKIEILSMFSIRLNLKRIEYLVAKLSQ